MPEGLAEKVFLLLLTGQDYRYEGEFVLLTLRTGGFRCLLMETGVKTRVSSFVYHLDGASKWRIFKRVLLSPRTCGFPWLLRVAGHLSSFLEELNRWVWRRERSFLCQALYRLPTQMEEMGGQSCFHLKGLIVKEILWHIWILVSGQGLEFFPYTKIWENDQIENRLIDGLWNASVGTWGFTTAWKWSAKSMIMSD